jgi:hypothetical protein
VGDYFKEIAQLGTPVNPLHVACRGGLPLQRLLAATYIFKVELLTAVTGIR